MFMKIKYIQTFLPEIGITFVYNQSTQDIIPIRKLNSLSKSVKNH
jgi:hypothetical protein